MKRLAEPENHRHYPGLDGLRAIAVLMVLEHHYYMPTRKIEWGWTGVRIFFVLSGFLITGILYDTGDARKRWSTFYARRSLRIFPLYFAVLLFGMAIYPVFRWVVHPSWVLWPLYLQNYARFIWPADIPSGIVDHLRSTRFTHPTLFLFYGHLWSLAVEEQFYLAWPLVVFTIKRRETLMKICVAAIFLTPLARLIGAFTLPASLLYAGILDRFTPFQCDSLLLGALLALWIRGPHPDFTRLAKLTLLGLAGILAVSAILSPILFHHPLYASSSESIFASLGYSCVNLMGAAVVLLAIDPTTWFSRLLQNRILRWLGGISYGFYVFHDMPHQLYTSMADRLPAGLRNPHNIVGTLFAIVGTTILASLSFYFFERPFLRLKRFFTIKPTSEPLPAPKETLASVE